MRSRDRDLRDVGTERRPGSPARACRPGPARRRSAPARGLTLAAFTLTALLAPPPLPAEQDTVDFCFNAWPPYAALADGVAVGMSVDIIREAARRAGLEVRFHELPWKRCLHQVKVGELDAVIDAAARSEYLHGPTSFSAYTNTFWVREDDPATGFELDAFRGKTVGLVNGYSYPDELLVDPPFEIDYSVDDDMNLRKLVGGRVDAVVADMVGTLHQKSERSLPVRPLKPFHSVDPLYPSFNAGRVELHRRIDVALDEMQRDGFIDRAYRQVLGATYSELIEASGGHREAEPQ